MICTRLFLTLAFLCAASHGMHMDQGPMHKTLADLMAKQSHLREITVTAPMMMKSRRTCTWHMRAQAIGENGGHLSTIYMRSDKKSDNCMKTTKASWSQTFPCVITKGSNHTACQGPLPAGAEEGTWEVSDVEPPKRWTGSFPAAPQILLGTSTPFVNKLNCESLGRLAVARAVQRTGVYIGNGSVLCQSAKNLFYLMVTGPEVNIWLRVHAADLDRQEAVTTKNVSWESGLDNHGHLVVSMEGQTASYTKELLSEMSLNIEGDVYDLDINTDYTDEEEPRLCTLSSLRSACSVMSSLSESEMRILGNVTGFNVHYWRPLNTKVTMQGYVLGTNGVIFNIYTASILDMNDHAWLELPLDSTTGCTPRLYSFSDCSELHAGGAPRLSPYQKRNEKRYVFP